MKGDMHTDGKSRSGNAIVEFALVPPLILLLLLAIFDFGIYAYAFISVQTPCAGGGALRNSGGMEKCRGSTGRLRVAAGRITRPP